VVYNVQVGIRVTAAQLRRLLDPQG
jgi:hypothetical protein